MQSTAMDAQATSTDGTESTPLCEFGAPYMLPTVKQFSEPEPRFYNGIWLGKDTTTGKSLVGIQTKGQSEARLCLVNTIKNYWAAHTGPWKTPASALPTPTFTTPLTMPAASNLHHDLCRRSPIHTVTKQHRHIVQKTTKGSSAETHRRPNSGIDHTLPSWKHITQRQLHRHQLEHQLCRHHPGRIRNDYM